MTFSRASHRVAYHGQTLLCSEVYGDGQDIRGGYIERAQDVLVFFTVHGHTFWRSVETGDEARFLIEEEVQRAAQGSGG